MRERTPRFAAFVVRSRATILVVVMMWTVGLAALAAVLAFQARVDSQRHAQAVVETIQRQAGELAELAFNPALVQPGAGPTIAQNKARLKAGKAALQASLSTLERIGSRTEDARLVQLNLRYSTTVTRVAELVASGSSIVAAAEFGRAERPGGSYFALVAELRHASVTYSDNAAHSRRTASVGTVTAIVFMLLAFSLTLYRATRLSREKQELLERSRIEALTDALTGLPNRRKLFADMETLLRESPPPTELAVGMFDLDGFKEYNDTFGHPAGDALLARFGQKLAATVDGRGSAYRMGGDEFCVIARGADAELVLSGAEEALSEHGELFDVSCSRGSVLISPGEMTLEQALQQADQRLYDDKRSSRMTDDAQSRQMLLNALADQDGTNEAHMRSVGRLASAVALKLGLSSEEVTLTRLAAELHDIGKTAVPESILNKSGPLDRAEWDQMKRHPLVGERILNSAPVLAAVAPLVRSSHERPDGAGYPDGLRDDEIPCISSIIAVVDAYDAMTTTRPYRTKLTDTEAIAELRRCAGTQFNDAAAAALIAICEERLKDGRGGAASGPRGDPNRRSTGEAPVPATR